jgi:hypothetical protein
MRKKNASNKILRFLILILVSGVGGYWLGKMGQSGPKWVDAGLGFGGKMLLIALLLPAFMVAVAWHEAGHAAAGVAMGFDFKMYIVGPFMWEKQNGRWHFKWNKKLNLAGGLVMCVPTGTHHLIRRMACYAAAGPLSSLLLAGGIVGILYRFVPTSLPIRDFGTAMVGAFLVFTALMSFFFFVATSIPSNMGGLYSDGARVLRLLKGGDTARFEVLFLKLVADTMSGLRPKSLDAKVLEELHSIALRQNEPFGAYLHGYAYYAAFDRGETDAAEKHLSDYINAVDQMPAGIRDAVWLDAAFFYACAKKDLAQAERYWEKFRPSAFVPKAQIFATEAAMALLKNDWVAAAAKKEAALAELPNMMDRGTAAALQERLATFTTAG